MSSLPAPYANHGPYENKPPTSVQSYHCDQVCLHEAFLGNREGGPWKPMGTQVNMRLATFFVGETMERQSAVEMARRACRSTPSRVDTFPDVAIGARPEHVPSARLDVFARDLAA